MIGMQARDNGGNALFLLSILPALTELNFLLLASKGCTMEERKRTWLGRPELESRSLATPISSQTLGVETDRVTMVLPSQYPPNSLSGFLSKNMGVGEDGFCRV